MKKEIEKQFIRLGRRREIQFQNEQIALGNPEFLVFHCVKAAS